MTVAKTADRSAGSSVERMVDLRAAQMVDSTVVKKAVGSVERRAV